MSKQSKHISEFCPAEVDGWVRLPDHLNSIDQNQFIFFNQAGLQLSTSVRNFGVLQVVHASIGQINGIRPDLTPEELHEYAISEHYNVLKTFFPEKTMIRAPDEEKHPFVHHFFFVIE